MSAWEQARLVRRGDVTAVELADAAIAGIEAVDGRLNAVVFERYERARLEAASIRPGDDRPLAGVPIVVKDLDGMLAGEPYGAGVGFLADGGYVPTESSMLFQRLVDAGAVIVAKTNTPELGLVPSTEPASTGPTRNPWDLDRSPAGSSGGSAALVAAGAVSIGHAGDGGGSIRLPASVCGLVGLKPSRGLVPNHPDVDPWGGLVGRLAVTRTVRDTALVLDVVAATDRLAAPIFGHDARSFVDRLGEPGRLRIGVAVAAPDGSPVDPAVAAVTLDVATALAELGHGVDEVDIATIADPAAGERRLGAFMTAFAVWTRATLVDLARRSGRHVTVDGVEPHTWAMYESAAAIDGVTFLDAVETLHMLGRDARRWWDGPYDVLLTPTCPERPWPLGQFRSTGDDPLAPLVRSAPIVAFAIPFNISGQPALSVPGGEVDGLPVGVQLVGRWGADASLLTVGAQLEQARPWAHRVPAVNVGRSGSGTTSSARQP